MSLCCTPSNQHDIVPAALGDENPPPRREHPSRGRCEALGSRKPDPVTHRLVGSRLVRQSHQAVVIALDLVALDTTIEDHKVRPSGTTKLELLDNTHRSVVRVETGSANAQSLADVQIEQR